MKHKTPTATLVASTIVIAERINTDAIGFVESAALYEAAIRLSAIDTALRDAISTYHGADKTVTAERIEAWQEALGDK